MSDLYSITEVALLAGVNAERISYHQRRGALPTPPRIGNRPVYSAEHAKIVVEYFRDRIPWSRIEGKEDQ